MAKKKKTTVEGAKSSCEDCHGTGILGGGEGGLICGCLAGTIKELEEEASPLRWYLVYTSEKTASMRIKMFETRVQAEHYAGALVTNSEEKFLIEMLFEGRLHMADESFGPVL